MLFVFLYFFPPSVIFYHICSTFQSRWNNLSLPGCHHLYYYLDIGKTTSFGKSVCHCHILPWMTKIFIFWNIEQFIEVDIIILRTLPFLMQCPLSNICEFSVWCHLRVPSCLFSPWNMRRILNFFLLSHGSTFFSLVTFPAFSKKYIRNWMKLYGGARSRVSWKCWCFRLRFFFSSFQWDRTHPTVDWHFHIHKLWIIIYGCEPGLALVSCFFFCGCFFLFTRLLCIVNIKNYIICHCEYNTRNLTDPLPFEWVHCQNKSREILFVQFCEHLCWL